MKLKPQWYLNDNDGSVSLTSETRHEDFPPEDAPLLRRLAAGIKHASELTPQEFERVVALNERGFLGTENHQSAPAWELAGLNFHQAQEQTQHLQIKVVDLTGSPSGVYLWRALHSLGCKLSNTPNITLVLANSYHDIKERPAGTWLPIIVNRVRISMGPMQFDWSSESSLVEKLGRLNHNPLPAAKYRLPMIFQNAQDALIAMRVARFLLTPQLRYVDEGWHINIATTEVARWDI